MSTKGWRAGLSALASIQILVAALLLSATSWAQQPVKVDIPSQPLGAALKSLANQAGIEVLFPSDLVAGKQAPAVSGSMSPEQALGELLKGSGLEARQSEPNRYVIQASPSGAGTAAAAVAAESSLPEVEVTDSVPPNPSLPPLPYAGGQVARGGQAGVLGNRDMMDLPFNQSSYTAGLMQNQQVRHIADVLANDPTAHANASASTGADDFSIRGFYVGNTDILFNGMPGVSPTFFNSMMAESVERVEVLKGPNALLNGSAPNGSVGGTINVIPKRAGDQPLTQFTGTYAADSQVGGHVDVGRRFGENKEFGIRFNGVYRNGDTAIEHQSRESQLAAFGLDYRGDRLRVSADLGYQAQDFRGIRDFTSVAAGVAVPEAPDSSSNYDGPNDFSDTAVTYGTLRGEFDIASQWTAFASVGGSKREQRDLLNNRLIVDEQGNLPGGLDDFSLEAVKMLSTAVEAGLHGRFATGGVQHQLTLAYSQFEREQRRINGLYAYPASNIYNPTFGPGPSSVPDLDDALKTAEVTMASSVLADTLSFLDERVQLTLGARLQNIEVRRFDPATGGLDRPPYDEQEVTPMVGVVVKPRDRLSLYANYVEGLEQGPTAPGGSANAGEIFPPSVTEQYELGAKMDFGRFGTTLSFYQITQPSGIVDPATNLFDVDGEQRHRGIDLNVYGEATRSIRLLGGIAYIDSELVKTENGVNQGNRGSAVPELRVVLGAEWDTPFLEGLTLTGRVTRNGSMYLDPANTQELPAWTRVDLGARYRINKMVVVRANVDNLLDENYWDANSFGQLSLSDPRTFSLSATFDF